MKVEIKRIDDEIAFFWRVLVNDENVSDLPTFRKAMNVALKFAPKEFIILDPLDI